MMINFTALMLASHQGHLYSVQILLRANADPDIKCSYTGCSALTLAVIATSYNVVQELLSAGANTNVTIKLPVLGEKELTIVECCLFTISFFRAMTKLSCQLQHKFFEK